MRLMRSLLVVLVLAVAGLSGAACSKDAPASDPAAVAGPAGKVVEATGKVTASRAGATRALAAGAEVFADDTIETASDASIVIELAHNQARWAVEGGMKARVDASLAWGLAQQAPVARVDHATSAAGRHAEKTAAETKEGAATARPEETSVVKPLAGNAQGGDDGEVRTDKNTKDPPPRPKPPQKNERPPGGCDEVACALDPSSACCAKRKAGNKTTGSSTPAADALPEAPSAKDIRAVMATLRVEAACGDGSVEGIVKLAIVVAADGTVKQVDVKEAPSPALGQCVVGLVKPLRFPRSQRGVTFTFPFRL